MSKKRSINESKFKSATIHADNVTIDTPIYESDYVEVSNRTKTIANATKNKEAFGWELVNTTDLYNERVRLTFRRNKNAPWIEQVKAFEEEYKNKDLERIKTIAKLDTYYKVLNTEVNVPSAFYVLAGGAAVLLLLIFAITLAGDNAATKIIVSALLAIDIALLISFRTIFFRLNKDARELIKSKKELESNPGYPDKLDDNIKQCLSDMRDIKKQSLDIINK